MQAIRSRFGAYFFLFGRLALGIVFIAASLDKIAHPADFAEIVSTYQILPGYMVNFVAIVLPWTEAVLGLLMLCGWWLTGATVLANLLLLSYFAALAQAWARGIDLYCGCFSSKSSGPHSMLFDLARDLFFLLLAAALLRHLLRAHSSGKNRIPDERGPM